MRKRYSRSYTVLSFLTMFSYRELPFAGFFFVSREIRCYDGNSAVYRIRCSVCDGYCDCTESKRCKANLLQEFSQNT